MAKCETCGTTILFGGVRDGDLRFCNEKCHRDGQWLRVAGQLPPDLVASQVAQVHQGSCPKCRGRGPVDVHNSYKVWSLLILTSWSTQPQVSCRSCGRKSQIGYTFFSLLCGWWGFPWGLIVTPVQLGRNLVALFSGPDPGHPSPQLESIVRRTLAAHVASSQNQV